MEGALKAIDAPYVEARFEESWYTTIQFRGKELDQVTTSVERGGIIRGFDGERYATIVYNDPKRLKSTKVLRLENKKAVKGLPPIKVEILVEKKRDPREVSIDEKIELLRSYNDIIIKTEGITTTQSYYYDHFRRRYYLNTEGRDIIEEVAYCGIMLSGIAKDGMNVQSYGKTFGHQEGFESLKGKEELAEEVAAKTLELIRAERVESGIYDCIIDPELAGVFIHEAFGHLAEADHLYENPRLLKIMAIGERIGCERLSCVDDPTLAHKRGSYRFDDEGVEGKKTYLIKEGRISSYLHSRETATKLGVEPTGNGRAINYNFAPIVRMSNTYILPGSASKEELFEKLDRGLYVCGSRGGQTALEDFIFAARIGYLIENGRITRPVREVILSGNIFQTLRNIVEVGNDLVVQGGVGGCGKDGQAPLPVGTGGPHLLIKGVVIGGR